MKKSIKSIIFSIYILFGMINLSFANESTDIQKTCASVASTAGGIAQFYESGKNLLDALELVNTNEFRSLSKDRQAIVMSLIHFVYKMTNTPPYEHVNGAYKACLSYQGNLQEMSDAINDILKKQAI